MKRVVDNAGNVIQGLYRANDGSIVVDDSAGLDKYKKQKSVVSAQKQTIEKLSRDVEELKALVGALLEGKNNG